MSIVKHRRGTTSQWASPTQGVLGAGEVGLNTTTDEVKIGDGATAFAALPTLNITDATALGKALVRAADQASAWTALGTVPTANLPDLSVIDYLGTSTNQAAMLAKTGQKGDWTIRTDTGAAFLITGADPTQIGSWTQLPYPDVVAASDNAIGTIFALTLAGVI